MINNISKLVDSWKTPNDGSRSLFESILNTPIKQALKDWTKFSNSKGILIGGSAVSFWVKPRMTHDLDILFVSDEEIPSYVESFKKTRPHCFLHKETHIEVEVLSPKYLKLPSGWYSIILKTAKESNGILIADKAALIALKLLRASYQDKHDIQELLSLGNIDLTAYKLSNDQNKLLDEIIHHTKHL